YARQREARQPYLEAQRAEAAARARSAGTVAYNGEIQWPAALRQESFDEQRQELEQLLSLQSQTGSTPVYAEQIYRLVQQMQSQLKDQILAMSANDYLAARKFLDNILVRARTEML